MSRFIRTLSKCSCVIAAFTMPCGLAGSSSPAQIAAAHAAAPAPAKPILFEIASIKPSRENDQGVQQFLPDGFLIRGRSVRYLICLAYYPLDFYVVQLIRNAPDWVVHDQFDVLAKVSTEDAPEWQRETTSSWDSPAFKHALQALLAERFKLQAHSIPIEEDGFALVVKHSARKTKLIPAAKGLTQDSAHSSSDNTPSITMPELDVIQFRNEPLSKLADSITSLSNGLIVEDRTGLTGRYNFSVSDRLPIRTTAEEQEDYRLPSQRWDVEPLGLELVRTKVHTTALIIDHIERPSPN